MSMEANAWRSVLLAASKRDPGLAGVLATFRRLDAEASADGAGYVVTAGRLAPATFAELAERWLEPFGEEMQAAGLAWARSVLTPAA